MIYKSAVLNFWTNKKHNKNRSQILVKGLADFLTKSFVTDEGQNVTLQVIKTNYIGISYLKNMRKVKN